MIAFLEPVTLPALSAAQIYAKAQTARHEATMRRVRVIGRQDAKFIAQLRSISQKFETVLKSVKSSSKSKGAA